MASWSIIRPGCTPRHPIRIDFSGFVRCVIAAFWSLFYRVACSGSGPKWRRRSSSGIARSVVRGPRWVESSSHASEIRGSNTFECCGDVGPAQGRERHGVRKPRDRLPARRTRRTRRAAGSDRRWARRQVQAVRLSDDGIFRDAHPTADLCCRVPLRPESPQLADRVVHPFEFEVRAAHQALLLLLFRRNPASWSAGGAPGKRPAGPLRGAHAGRYRHCSCSC